MGTNSLKIRSRAPTRIDLAGGTLDIWPIYLFVNQPTTVNVAIDLYAEAEIEECKSVGSDSVILRAEDQSIELSLTWQEVAKPHSVPPSLELHYKLLRYFLLKKKQAGTWVSSRDLRISTRAQSPAGAGIGGSSSLTIALAGALSQWAGGKEKPEELISIARDIETTVIQVPAGLQDYYGATFGGLQSLQWGISQNDRHPFSKKTLLELDHRLLLFYSGQSRNSGINNWALFKSFIDRKDEVRERFDKISAASFKLVSAFQKEDWNEAALSIQEEWQTRKNLAPGITTPEIEAAFTAAKRLGISSGKICGAGGGGCFFFFIPDADPELKKNIQIQVSELGIKPLPIHVSLQGLEVQVMS